MTKRRRNIPLTSDGDAVACHNCVAACCRAGTNMPLSTEERRANLLKFRTETITPPAQVDRIFPSFSPEEPARMIPAGWGVFRLVQDCGNLTSENMCRVYDQESPVRPGVCESFEVGSVACLILRARCGLEDQIPRHLQVAVQDGVAQMQQGM